jgi:hypothetical protein
MREGRRGWFAWLVPGCSRGLMSARAMIGVLLSVRVRDWIDGSLMSLRKLKTSSVPWFGLAGLAFVLGVFVLAGVGQAVALLVALGAFLGACLRGLVLAVRDDEVGSASIRDPAARTMGVIGADSAAARRQRRLARKRREGASR